MCICICASVYTYVYVFVSMYLWIYICLYVSVCENWYVWLCLQMNSWPPCAYEWTVAGGHPQQGQELWEQLLEDALETNQKDIDFNVSQRASAFSLYEGNQSWLASPGNPFIEGTARTSNFLEIESLSIPTFQRALMNAEEESFQNSYGNRDPLSGMFCLIVSEIMD